MFKKEKRAALEIDIKFCHLSFFKDKICDFYLEFIEE